MNYQAHYDHLITMARGRVLNGYTERHHIVPRCMGGSNKKENLAHLTPEEHFLAHQLLIQMFPTVRYLVSALVWMAHRCNNNKIYGWIRRRHASNVSVSMSGNTFWLGKKHTAEWRSNMSVMMTGRKMSPKAIEKMAAGHRGKTLSVWHISRIVAANTGIRRSPETRARMSAAKMGVPVSSEARKKISESNRKRVYTQQMRANMSAAHIGKKKGPCSQATRDKISAAHKRRFQMLNASRQVVYQTPS